MSVVWCVLDGVEVKIAMEETNPDFDDIKGALKSKWRNRFVGVDTPQIIIKHPDPPFPTISNRVKLREIEGAAGLVFLVDAPPAGNVFPIRRITLI